MAKAKPEDKLPPNSIEAEQGILGCVLCDPDKAVDTMMRCLQHVPGPEVFFSLQHRTIYELLLEMHDKRERIDLITVQQKLKDRNQLDAVGGLVYLASLPDMVPGAAHVDYYTPIVFEKYKLRRMLQVCWDIVSRINRDEEGASHNLEDMQKDLIQATQMTTRKADWAIKAAIQGAIQDIDMDIRSGGAITGLPSGLRDIDQKTKGFHRGEFIVIAARPSCGKSALCMNIAEHLAVDRCIPVGVFSLEMPKKSLMRRMLSAKARIDVFAIADDLFQPEEVTKLTRAGGQIAAAPLYIDDTPGLDDIELRAGIRQMYHDHGIQAVVIDYFQLLHARKRFDNRQLELAYISAQLKQLFRELNIAGIVAAQLNREAEALTAKGDRPRMSHLKDCGGVEQDADLIGLLYPTRRDDDNDWKDKKSMPSALDIAKQRNGPTGPVPLMFRKNLFRFEQTIKIREEDVPK